MISSSSPVVKSVTVRPRSGAGYTRLDAFLASEFPELSRSYFQKLIEAGNVLIDGLPCENKSRVKGGETVSWIPLPAADGLAVPERIPLDVIHEDGDIIVVDKPAGLVVHPACGHPTGTLVNALAGRAEAAGESWRPYLVHRLDKDTTGVIVAAKNERAKINLSNQFKRRLVDKTYVAVVKGEVDFARAVIDAPLGRSPANRFMIEVGAGARKESLTEVERVAYRSGASVFLVRPKTGRTHQIRAHFSYIGHPILGDRLYGGASGADEGVSRPLLHAFRIEFNHPSSKRRVGYEARLPSDIAKYVSGVKL